MRKEDFTAAFALGFLVSREGFNAECPYPHLAPDNLLDLKQCVEETVPGMTNLLSAMPEFLALRDQAWALQSRAHSWNQRLDCFWRSCSNKACRSSGKCMAAKAATDDLLPLPMIDVTSDGLKADDCVPMEAAPAPPANAAYMMTDGGGDGGRSLFCGYLDAEMKTIPEGQA